MDMVTVGWIALVWFTVAVLTSLALGSVFRLVNAPVEAEDAVTVAKRRIVVTLRNHKPAQKRHAGTIRHRLESTRQATG